MDFVLFFDFAVSVVTEYLGGVEESNRHPYEMGVGLVCSLRCEGTDDKLVIELSSTQRETLRVRAQRIYRSFKQPEEGAMKRRNEVPKNLLISYHDER